MASVDRIDHRDRQTLGFHPEHWLATQRARALMMLDRMPEAEPLIGKLLAGELGPVDTLHRVLAIGVLLEGAARTEQGVLAARHLDALDDVVKDNETPYLRVLCGRYRGIALYASGDVAGAESEWRSAMDYALSHRTGLEMKAQFLELIAKARQSTSATLVPQHQRGNGDGSFSDG
jgi:hypothetical protein